MSLNDVYIGWDQSVNHAGVVVLDGEGNVGKVYALVERAKDARHKGTCRIPSSVSRISDRHLREFVKACIVTDWARSIASNIAGYARSIGCHKCTVAMEDYAYSTAKAHRVAEISFYVRRAIVSRGMALRLHDPLALKIFATGSGATRETDTKSAVIAAAKEHWDVDYSSYGAAQSDLTDAHVLAVMAMRECQLRSGAVTLQDLPERERRIFLRITKSCRTNLLERPFITSKLVVDHMDKQRWPIPT